MTTRRIGPWGMTEDRYERVKHAFFEVCDLPPAEQTPALDRICADDPAFRAEVESLLANLEESTLR